MNKIWIIGVFCILLIGPRAVAQEVNLPKFSKTALQGQQLFKENCSQCHGDTALGTDFGPPLLHPFYRPSHHDDEALANAVKNGVVAHHWQFGPMPVIATVKLEDIPKLVHFIRELQRANGIK